jgi:hypothetical protein
MIPVFRPLARSGLAAPLLLLGPHPAGSVRFPV